MERARPILIALGYSAWFSLLFVAFTWITFPWSKVSEQITVAAAGNNIAFQTKSLRPAIVGAKAKGLIVGPLGGGDGAAWLQAEKLTIRTGVGGALAAGMAVRAISGEGGVADQGILMRRLLTALGEVTIDGAMYGDELHINLADEQAEAMRLALKTGRLDLSAYPIKSDAFAAAPGGRLTAEADVLWHWEDPKKSSGSVDLSFEALHLAGFKVAGFALPETTFDRAEAHLKLGKGRAEFRNTAFESEVVQAEIEGFINLRTDVTKSTLALRVKFKVRQDLEGLLSLAGLKQTSTNRDNDGWFHYQVQGRIGAPRFKARRVAQGAGGGVSSKPTGLEDSFEDDGSDEDDEPPRKPAVSRAPRKRMGGSGGDEPVSRNEMSDERRVEIEAERQRLREERLQRREERRLKREELMQKRQERQGAVQDEDEDEDVPTHVQPRIQPPDIEDDFDRSNGGDEVDEGGEDEGGGDEDIPVIEGEDFEE